MLLRPSVYYILYARSNRARGNGAARMVPALTGDLDEAVVLRSEEVRLLGKQRAAIGAAALAGAAQGGARASCAAESCGMRTQFEWRRGGEPGMLGTVGAEYEIPVAAKNHAPMADGAGGGHPVRDRLDVVERVRNARAGCAPAVAGLVRRAGPMDYAQFITLIKTASRSAPRDWP